MAELAKGRLRNKLAAWQQALTGVVRPHHRFLLAQHLAHIDFLDEQIVEVGREIEQRIAALSQPALPAGGTSGAADTVHGEEAASTTFTWAQAVTLLDTAPGVDQCAAEIVLAEKGRDMRQFPNEDHLTAWGGLAPGNNQSGSKRRNAKTRKGNRTLRQVMLQLAWAAVHTKNRYAQALYRRLAARRSQKRAIVAVARALLASFLFMLSRRQPYQELGGDYFDQRRKTTKVDPLTKLLGKLGYAVHLEPLPPQPLLA
jgi:transposase